MESNRESSGFSKLQVTMLVVLRAAIGWHFLYEGAVKLFSPGWTSAGYLRASKWLFADTFHWIADTPTALAVVDLMNVWGLILIGLGLMAGVLWRWASVSGALLLVLYYVGNPPFMAAGSGAVMEGSYLYVDKNFVEFCALCALAAVPSRALPGLGHLLSFLKRKGPRTSQAVGVPQDPAFAGNAGRRTVLKALVSLPFLGAFAFAFLRKKALLSHEEKNLVDAVSSATVKKFEFTSLDQLKGQVPSAKIGNVELSRLILGGNLIGGWAHARDLIYVSKLVKAYHHREKVFETFALAEQCGVNTILTNPALCGIINDYWDSGIGKIQFISDCGGGDLLERVQESIDKGACACYIQGGVADRMVQEGKFDLMGKALDLIRDNKMPAGLGGHRLDTVMQCVDKGLKPDFWMKTLHKTDYWSAQPEQERDNIWCWNPEETIQYMNGLEQPWIAFKILAAGAYHPSTAFKYAFESGADFVCVGMYDFQIVDDVNMALDVLNAKVKRQRPWRA